MTRTKAREVLMQLCYIMEAQNDFSLNTKDANSQKLEFKPIIGIGIGTTNPTRQVTIRKDIANGVGASLMLVNSSYSANSGAETEIIMNHYTYDNNPFRYAKIHTVGANEEGTVDRLSLGLVNISDLK